MNKKGLRNKTNKPKRPAVEFNKDIALLVVIVILTVTSGLAIIVLNHAITALEIQQSAANALARRYNYGQLKENAAVLEKKGSDFNVKSYSLDEAIVNILNKADDLRVRYQASIMQNNVEYHDGIVTINATIIYVPSSSNDFLNLIDELTENELPMIYIYEADIDNVEKVTGKYQVTLLLTFKHPYVENI